MKQTIKIHAEYEYSEEEIKQWNEHTKEERQERMEMTKGALLEEFDEFKILEIFVNVE